MKTVRRARRGLSGAELPDRTQNIGGDFRSLEYRDGAEVATGDKKKSNQSESRK